MTMVENVAKALIQQIGSPWPYDKMDPAVKALWQMHARAAIKAMRDLSQDADDAGFNALPAADGHSMPSDFSNAWCAAIDSALAE